MLHLVMILVIVTDILLRIFVINNDNDTVLLVVFLDEMQSALNTFHQYFNYKKLQINELLIV